MIDRRAFIKLGGIGLAGLLVPGTDFASAQQPSIKPQRTADACIFINLVGGPSHVDTFDVKLGSWTPQDFDIRKSPGGVSLSYRLFPHLFKLSRHLTFVRSVEPWDAEHKRAQYYLQTAHAFNPGFVQEIPHIGSVVAFEAALERGGKLDVFPPFVVFNGSPVGSGFLPASCAPFITYAYASNTSHPQGKERFHRRWNFLEKLDRPLRQGMPPQGKAFSDFYDTYLQAKKLSDFGPFEEAFTFTEEESKRYGENDFGNACIIAWKVLKANRGTRFITIDLGDWDQHGEIYKEENLPALCKQLDDGLGNLISDLQRTPSPALKGRTMLDRTFIVVMGEFGRTAGNLNESKGRDHHIEAEAVLFVGGGVKGGRVIGETDRLGDKIVDNGWKHKRSIRMEDIAATIYSALGINWTKSIYDTPSGREFEYIPYVGEGRSSEISELF